MQHSVTCISTGEGGIPDIVEEGKTGFIVAKQNPTLLAEKIGFLINNPQLAKQYGISAKDRFEKMFTLKTFENRMKEIFNKMTIE